MFNRYGTSGTLPVAPTTRYIIYMNYGANLITLEAPWRYEIATGSSNLTTNTSLDVYSPPRWHLQVLAASGETGVAAEMPVRCREIILLRQGGILIDGMRQVKIMRARPYPPSP